MAAILSKIIRWTSVSETWIIVEPQVGQLGRDGLAAELVPQPRLPEEDPLANDKDSISNLRSESSKTDKRKQSLYFPESMLQEIKEEAARLDRSLSWVVQRAWKISRLEIKKLPSVNEVDGGDDDDEA